MKKKFFFLNEDEPIAYNLKHWQRYMIENEITEMEVVEAVPICDAKAEYVFCKSVDECCEKSDCNKQCSDYEPKNGKNGKCIHKGIYCDFGESITLKLSDCYVEKPIPFSTPMVRSVLAGIKRMTRRTAGLEKVNEKPYDWEITNDITDSGILFFNKNGFSERVKPRYHVGDRLWVKETYFDTRKFKNAPLFACGPDFVYRADGSFIGENKWIPSMFMRKEASRICLEVTAVRCEKLMDISEEDAIEEGIESWESPVHPGKKTYQNYNYPGKSGIDCPFLHPVSSFMTLWEKINGKNSWFENPWVFVYEFKVISKP
ncbi:MAG TPA: hypothetical protein VK152_00250 [Paludibacter sp.]|nr:hypothetical protein [Paludibacter sp.]